MKKRCIVIALSAILCFQNISMAAPVYAKEATVVHTNRETNTKENRIIYLENGEGAEGAGSGTETNPYKNIRTALAQAEDGDTIILVGEVVYTKYAQDSAGGALPLYINNDITIKGQNRDSGLSLRSTIQLGADVTFQGMNLSIIPQVSLGGIEGSRTGILGDKIERSNTIFTAGHNLTLDDVNTQVGTSPEQYGERPYICGGTFKGIGATGEKSVITILNPNSETKLGGIYAGDYLVDRDMDVEINLDGKLIDTTIHTGGINGVLSGDVQINIFGKSNVRDIDQRNHNGAVHVTLMDQYKSTMLSMNGIDTLHLTEDTKIMPPSQGVFQVKDVVLDANAILDFREMENQPVVQGDFIGVNTTDVSLSGHVLLSNDQTLTIGGQVTGLTRLNAGVQGYIQPFQQNHVYVTVQAGSSGGFSIEGTTYTEYELLTTTENNTTSWKVSLKKVEEGLTLQSFKWIGGNDTIVKPSYESEYIYPIQFYNKNNEEFKPTEFDLLYNYEYSLVRADGKPLDTDWEVFIDWYFFEDETDTNDRNGIKLIFYTPEKEYGDIILTVTHVESGKKLERIISVRQDEIDDSQSKPSESPSVTPTIKLNKTSTVLYATGKSSTLQLTPTVVGASKCISYSSSKPSVAQVSKTGKITAKSAGTAIITAKANGVSATCKVTVKRTSLKLNKTKATLYTKGSTTLQLKATTIGASRVVEYSSNRRSVAQVDKYGKVTVKGVGTAIITAKANGLSTKCTITVKKPTLTVSQTKMYLKKGKVAQLRVKATPARKITFTSSKKQYVSVTRNGKIKGIKAGTSIITIKCNGITKKVTVVVKNNAK